MSDDAELPSWLTARRFAPWTAPLAAQLLVVFFLGIEMDGSAPVLAFTLFAAAWIGVFLVMRGFPLPVCVLAPVWPPLLFIATGFYGWVGSSSPEGACRELVSNLGWPYPHPLGAVAVVLVGASATVVAPAKLLRAAAPRVMESWHRTLGNPRKRG